MKPIHTLTGPPDTERVGRVFCIGEGCPVCQLFYDQTVFEFNYGSDDLLSQGGYWNNKEVELENGT